MGLFSGLATRIGKQIGLVGPGGLFGPRPNADKQFKAGFLSRLGGDDGTRPWDAWARPYDGGLSHFPMGMNPGQFSPPPIDPTDMGLPFTPGGSSGFVVQYPYKRKGRF